MKVIDIPIDDDKDIPDKSGIYAFFLDLGIFLKSIEGDKKFPERNGDLEDVLSKVESTLRLTDPKEESLNLYGISKCVELSLSTKHRIKSGIDIGNIDEKFARLVSLCSIMSKPVYIGKALDTNLRKRFKRHRSKYRNLPDKYDDENTDNPYSIGGDFPEKVRRRGIGFNDLLFTCVPVENNEQKDSIDEVESLLHSISNPPLSVKYD